MATLNRLIILTGSLKGREVPVEGVVSIGRNPENMIQLDDLQVSRKHAQVIQKDDGVFLVDLGSGNGTYIGPERIVEHRLEDGDIFRMGRQQIQFRAGAGAGAGMDAVSRGAMEIPEEKEKPKAPEKETASDAESAPGLDVQRPAGSEDWSEHIEGQSAENLYQTFFAMPGASATGAELVAIQKRLRAVYAANQAIASERTLGKVFDAVMGQIFSLIKAHNGLIMLKQEGSSELNVEYVRSADPGAQINVSSTIIKRVYDQGEAVATSNAANDERFGGGMSIISGNITSAMCVPLTHQDEK
ncbi:MAG TPA: FHA domain-containing protein, partial [Candidatus Hydrogenedentes bacterium]|nr:FHA domain-containing protein [Candidatus Hydrogenedentota bacterium]